MNIETPKTLADILQFLDAVDQGVIDPTPEKKAEVAALLVAKIDNTADVLDELEHQAERLRQASAKLAEGKRQVLARVERIKEYIAFHMQQGGFTQLPGECWKAKLTTGLGVSVKRDPTVLDMDNPAFAACVRVKFEWDKKGLKAALEAMNPEAMGVAELVPSASVSMAVNKGRLK
jgi:hypothetical protein